MIGIHRRLVNNLFRNRLYPLSCHQVVFLSQSSCVWPVEHTDGTRRGGGGGGVAKSYDGEKALSSISHSILSGMYKRILHFIKADNHVGFQELFIQCLESNTRIKSNVKNYLQSVFPYLLPFFMIYSLILFNRSFSQPLEQTSTVSAGSKLHCKSEGLRKYFAQVYGTLQIALGHFFGNINKKAQAT